VVLHRIPDEGVVDDTVAVYQHILEVNDSAGMADLGSQAGLGFQQAAERRADDLKLLLDAGVQQLIAGVIVQRPAGSEA
jgi:hypothetical protein